MHQESNYFQTRTLRFYISVRILNSYASTILLVAQIFIALAGVQLAFANRNSDGIHSLASVGGTPAGMRVKNNTRNSVRPARTAQSLRWEGNLPIFRKRKKQRSSAPVMRNPDPYPGQPFQNGYGRSRFWDDYSQPGIYHGGTYRTMCVRLCDGYYWPISFSTYRSHFSIDESQCHSSCSSPVRLFYYRNPGSVIDNMQSLEGVPYRHLINAYLYRKKFTPDCRCRPDPWSEVEVARHRSYSNGGDETHHAGQHWRQFRHKSRVGSKLSEKSDSEREISATGKRWIIPESSQTYNRFKIITLDSGLETDADSDATVYQNKRSKYYRGRQRVYRTYRYLHQEAR